MFMIFQQLDTYEKRQIEMSYIQSNSWKICVQLAYILLKIAL